MATTTTLTKSVVTLHAAGTANAAGAGIQYGTAVDLRSSLGGLLTIKITNGAAALGAQATATILAAHNTGATPTPGPAGADWKTLYQVGNGLAANTVGEWSYNVPQGVMHLEVAVGGNTTTGITFEAFLSKLDSASSV